MSKLHSPLSYAVLAAALTSASAAFSLGLGEASISSKLGQPLEARIPLTQLAGLTDNQLVIKVEPVWDDVTGTAMGGVDPRQLVLETAIDSADYGVLRLRTRQPLTEPFLNFVVTVRWPDGVISREYTLLLDLPTSLARPSAPGVQPGNSDVFGSQLTTAAERPTGSQAAGVAKPVAEPVAKPKAATQPTSPSIASSSPGVDGHYTTRRGDSLWSIAAALRSSLGGTIKQRMAKIYASNPEAFVRGNPALLKEHVVLDVSQATMRSASTTELPQPETVAATSARGSQPAPAPQSPGSGPGGDGGEDKLNAIRREISQVTEAMAEMSDKLADLQRQLREVSDQQAVTGSDTVSAAGAAMSPGEAGAIATADTDPQPEVEWAPVDGPAIAVTEEQVSVMSESPAEEEGFTDVAPRADDHAAGSDSLVNATEPSAGDDAADMTLANQVSASADNATAEGAPATGTVASPQQTDSAAGSSWLRWLALPVLAILALLWWRQRRGDKAPTPVAMAERESDDDTDWAVSAPRARPRAPASDEFSDLFSELAQDNHRDLPGASSQQVRSNIDAQPPVPPAPLASVKAVDTSTSSRRSAFDEKEFAQTASVGDNPAHADLEDGLEDLDFDDIDLNEQAADMPAVETAEALAERAAACMALADYSGAREILESALHDSTDTALQLQLLDVYAAQGDSAEFEALALQMQFAGADDNTLAEIQLIRDKFRGAADNSDYNGHSA